MNGAKRSDLQNKNYNFYFVMTERKGRIEMADLNQIELQHLRHLIGAHETAYQKLNTYSSQAVDPQIKQLFTKAAQDSLNTKQKLMTFLNN